MTILRLLGLLAIISMGLSFGEPAHAFSPAPAKSAIGTLIKVIEKCTTKCVRLVLPDTEIIRLAKIAEKPGGTKTVKNILGQMNLPNEVLEDAFARILIAQNRLQRSEAEGWMQRLSGVPGFRSAMSKSMGASPAKTAGHFNEIRIADNAAQANFKVKGIGVQFKDPNKAGDTDIDVLLEQKGRTVAIEAKDYLSNTEIPLGTFRADMLSLAEYRKVNPGSNVLTVFTITNKPADPDVWKLLEASAKQHQVELLVGPPGEVAHQMPLLLK